MRSDLPTKHRSFFLARTALILPMLHFENLLLLGLSPEVALAYMMKLPRSLFSISGDSPGVHSLPESC